MFGFHRNQREAGGMRPFGKLSRSEAAGGVAIATLAVGSMLAGAPVVLRALPANADTIEASVSSKKGATAAIDRAQEEGGVLSTSAKERAESGEYPELTPESEPWIGRPAQNVLVDRAYTSRRVEFPVGKPVTLNNEEWATSEAKVTFGWTGTMRVTCNGATAYEDYASAGIAQNALNFDANSADWQDKAEAINYGREPYQLVVVDMTFENIDATSQMGDLGEFYASELGLYNESSSIGNYAQSGYFFAWSSCDHEVRDEHAEGDGVWTSSTFSLDPGASQDVQVAFWVPKREVEEVRAGKGEFVARIGDTFESEGDAGDLHYPSKAVSWRLDLQEGK